ncbi:MAG TPA: hypothetical protein VGQ93_00350 [Lysobacter sp.]|jgi:hypothetical protein|nr:hypothetical protein [Lysobacter sp.]
MRSKFPLLVLLGILFSGSASADQYVYVTLQQATDALKVLTKNREIHEFCAPCGDATSKPIPVRQIEISRVWEGQNANAYRSDDGKTFWEVIVNNETIDLAYVYVRKGGKWENLALSLGLDASGVPRHLGKHQIGY